MDNGKDGSNSSALGWMSVKDGSRRVATISSDGPCLKGTLDNLRSGVAGRPMDGATLDQARRQALSFLQELVNQYESDVAIGEVGASGSGMATEEPPISSRCPTGLLYGRVQSGKTLAMIALTAAAFDNGFRLIVVFTSNYVELVRQTRKRFEAVDGRKIFDSTRPEEWNEEREHIRRQLSRSGLVIVCAKDPTHTRALVDLLREVDASRVPAIVFDDEADQATPDTTVAARAKGGKKAPQYSSTIFRRIVANDEASELGHSVRENLRHHLFIQVTATPYALFLQSVDHPLRSKFTLLVEPGGAYTGGERFFSAAHVQESKAKPPLVYIPDDEAAALAAKDPGAPLGLARAICFFLLSAMVQQMLSEGATGSQNFLCHTSAKKGDHTKLSVIVRKFVDQLETELLEGALTGSALIGMNWAYEELKITVVDLPPLLQILNRLKNRLHLRNFYVVNSDRDGANFSSGVNFVIGGNILGRGLTIENLLVTYYLRSAKITQMDTMLQHARMFGYREKLMPYTRVFLPQALAVRFHSIHSSEEALRAQFQDSTNPGKPVIHVGPSLRPTRLNILDGSSIAAFSPGQHIYPMMPVFKRVAIGSSERKIHKVLSRLLGEKVNDARFVEVPISEVKSLIRLVPVSDADLDRWDAASLCSLLDSVSDQCGAKSLLYVRKMDRTRQVLVQGAVSGKELQQARARNVPTLFLFREEGVGEPWEGVPFYYPTLVLPSSMKDCVFNIS